ncbi:hypothetical protein [uncultured Bacteroides sp.]|uniref:hypothetical protein n=1 Tax=uncultured Bacteroides sp. TaxID=162156 RepID=UPI0025E411B4|nr:hypothetical protein [uncultured Bacteroides sp.]
MDRIFEIKELAELEAFLKAQSDVGKWRHDLLAAFSLYAHYKNAEEWNRAVRICESLAIIGWGTHEALEAVKGCVFNGNPSTCFINKYREPRFAEAIWSKRKNGYTMETGAEEAVRNVKLDSQRNWIPKNPVWIVRGISNCYDNSKAVIESVEKDLQVRLNERMRPELYGTAVNQITVHCSYSYYDHRFCKCNYIIADEKLNLKQKDLYPALLAMFTKQEIEKNGYLLRNRLELGPFRADTGRVRAVITLEKEFSELSHSEQKKKLGEYILSALCRMADRLKKKVDYDFERMLADFKAILAEWENDFHD